MIPRELVGDLDTSILQTTWMAELVLSITSWMERKNYQKEHTILKYLKHLQNPMLRIA